MLKNTDVLIKLNKRFNEPLHPFNLRNDGVTTYAKWQFAKGEDTIKFFLNFTTIEEMFQNKTVVDIGCGAAGKTLYYASLGADRIIGLEILEKYREEANALAEDMGYADKFSFVCADAATTGLESSSIDTVIMNDAMEHVENPNSVLQECLRILKPGGRVFINFPPYYHPFGAHLSDAIFIPWVHVFFSERTLINAYKRLVSSKPDGDERVDFRISTDESGQEYFSYINKMTIKRFKSILKNIPAKRVYYREAPLRKVFAAPAKLPFLKEFFVKMVVVVLEK